MTILQDMQMWRFWRHFLVALFACVGGLSPIMQTFNVIYPGSHAMEGFAPFHPAVIHVRLPQLKGLR